MTYDLLDVAHSPRTASGLDEALLPSSGQSVNNSRYLRLQ